MRITSKLKLFTLRENDKFAEMFVDTTMLPRTPHNIGYERGLAELDEMLNLTRLAQA